MTQIQTRAVPLSLPLGFFVLAWAWFALGSFLLALHPEGLQALRHPYGLAVAHLLLLGFGTGVLLGALHQLLPVVLEVPLPWPSLGYWTMGLWGVGVPLLVLAFFQSPGLTALSGGLVLFALLILAYQTLLAFRLAPRWNRVATALAWAMLYLLLTPIWGLLQALSLRWGVYDPDRIFQHLVFGLLGVFLLSIIGVGYKLVSMFTLTHGVDEGVLGLFLWLANLGLWALALGEKGGYALLLLAYLLALYDTHRILKNRMKRELDIGVKHYLAGLFFLGIALLALPFAPMKAGVWFVLGFVGLVVTGMLYKILPFLVWTHRYAPKAGKERTPLLKEMLPEKAAYLAGGLFALGALGGAFFPWALWLYALGVWPFLYAMEEVMRR